MFAIVIAVFLLGCASETVSESVQECGVMSSSDALVQNGFDTEREMFPWIVSLAARYSGVWLYAASGSLISDRHILSGANSVAYENYYGDSLDLNPEQNYIAYDGEDVRVIFGSSSYNKSYEPGALLVTGASKVVLHPNAAGMKPRVFNVALIFLKESVPFSEFIYPICLQSSVDDVLGKTVYAAGFGVDHTGSMSGKKKHVPMVVLDDLTCQKFYRETLQRGKASKFFCARGNGLQTPCRYDKPLYIKIGDRWFLQAMSSMFKTFKSTRACRPRAPVLYEDITSLTEWIETEMNRDNLI